MMDEEPLMLSGIQHFAYCPRQWALIHIEQQWAENTRTVDGNIFHKKTHEASHELRGDTLVVRELRVTSRSLMVSGICDVVEFRRNDDGVPIHTYDGLWLPYPVEYKRGEPKENDADRLQLCAQAMCLEEMLACTISEGALFYGETRRREAVPFTTVLRVKAIPHNSAAASAANFAQSPACKNLDLPPVNLRFLQLYLAQNSSASASPHLRGITLRLRKR